MPLISTAGLVYARSVTLQLVEDLWLQSAATCLQHWGLLAIVKPLRPDFDPRPYIHTYIHTYIHIYICICVCVCVQGMLMLFSIALTFVGVPNGPEQADAEAPSNIDSPPPIYPEDTRYPQPEQGLGLGCGKEIQTPTPVVDLRHIIQTNSAFKPNSNPKPQSWNPILNFEPQAPSRSNPELRNPFCKPERRIINLQLLEQHGRPLSQKETSVRNWFDTLRYPFDVHVDFGACFNQLCI